MSRPAPRRRNLRLRVLIVALIVLVVLGGSVTRFYTDLLWFEEVGLTAVLWTSLGVQFTVGAAVGIATALILWLNLTLAGRVAPAYRIRPTEGIDPLDRLRDVLTPYLRWVRLGIALFIGFVTGAAATTAWETVLLWSNRQAFGIADPQFGRDVGFYVFELPFMHQVLDWLWVALMTSLVFSIGAHVFHGAVRPQASLRGVLPAALAHVSVLLGLLALVKAGQYRLGQFDLNFSTRGQVTGASYTDVHAQLPALKLLVIISIISAILFLVNIRFRTLSLPAAAVGIWILTAFLAGGVWPLWVQRFSVDPQELQRERPFIERNIAATRAAFGLGDVETQTYPATTTLTAEQATANEEILQNVRVWDPGILQRAYQQLQAIRLYYNFEDVDIDRYEIGGEIRQVLLSGRELSVEDLDEKSQTWSNIHLQFTHGYGFVASLANAATTSGQPQFLVKDVPGTVQAGAESLEVEQPAIYYGEGFDDRQYSIVNSEQPELDYPTEEGVQRSSYEGAGGVALSSPLRRLAFAVREGDPNLILSSLIRGDSRILLYRNIRDRVLRAAPFLALDHDPYLVAAGDRFVWILDGYTTTRWYPYSQRFDLGDIVQSDQDGVLTGSANYVRNSVKIVVDAYDGTMDFHIVDEGDPLIQAYRSAFPELFATEEPEPEIVEHFRYPENIFDVQTEVYLTYHMTDPEDFYAKEDAWAHALSSTASGETGGIVSGRYLLTRLPGEEEQEFLILKPATPRGKNNMVALMVGRSDPEVYGEFQALLFPRQKQVPGPVQVDNLINQDVEISQTLTLLGQQGSTVEFGSLITLPIEGSILYVQPLFVTAQQVGIPELKKVALVLGQEVVLEDGFEEALLSLFGADEGAEPTPAPTRGAEPGDDDEPEAQLEEIVAEAAEVYERAQEALADGNFALYGRLIERLGDLLSEAAALAR